MKLFKFAIAIGMLFVSLIACRSADMSFEEIVASESEIVEIKARNHGGYFYKMTNQEKINDFLNLFHGTTFIETEKVVVFGGVVLDLLDADGKEITSIFVVDKNVFRIGDAYYKSTKDIEEQVQNYLAEHFKTENLVIEEDMVVNINADIVERITIKNFQKNVSVAVEDREAIAKIVTIFNVATKHEGIANMTNPEYVLNFGQVSYFLWINGENLTLRDTKNSHYIFTLKSTQVKEIENFLMTIFK